MYYVFFFNDTATTEIYTLSLHDALPIYTKIKDDRRMIGSRDWRGRSLVFLDPVPTVFVLFPVLLSFNNFFVPSAKEADRKSTRLNSSHANISYAVFCLKKKKQPYFTTTS